MLASNTAPVREVITHDRNGLLANFFDVDGLAGHAIRVLREPGKYRHLGAAAVGHILQNYSTEVALPKLLRFLERVANRRSLRR